MTGPLDIRMVLNNDINVQFNVLDIDGVPINITGFTILWQVKKSYLGLALISKTVGSGILITNAAGGVFVVSIAAADTAAMSPGEYKHECCLTDTYGKSVTLTGFGLEVGRFVLREEYAVQS